MTKILLLLVLVVWPLGQLALLPTIFGQRWFALDLLTALLWLPLLRRWRRLFVDPLWLPFLIFSLALTTSLLVNFAWSFHLVRWLSAASVYFALRQVSLPRKWFSSSMLVFTVFGLLQYLLLPDTRFLKDFGFDDHYFRLLGTLFDPNFAGLLLSQIFFLTVFPLKLLTLLALTLTFSRASYLAFSCGLLVAAFRHRRLLLLIPVLAILIWLAPKPFGEGVNLLRTFSISSRFNSQLFGLRLFVQRPVFGWGFGVIKPGIDNSFIYLLATSGTVGLGAFAYFIYRLLRHSWSTPAFIPIVIALIHSLSNNSFFYLWQVTFLWMILGLFTPSTPPAPIAPPGSRRRRPPPPPTR